MHRYVTPGSEHFRNRLLNRRTLLLLTAFVLGSAAPAVARDGVVSTAHPLATEAGVEMLRKGGNAIDAAIAASLALGVVEPQSSGIGGGGFALVWLGRTAEARVLDFREAAPGQAAAAMYLDRAGKVIPRLSLDGYRAAGVPGQAAGLVKLQQAYAALPLVTLAEPAIRLAREGFLLSDLVRGRIEAAAARLGRDPEASRIFLVEGKAPPAGYRLQQPDLARTLQLWVNSGGDSFYRGETAAAMAAAMAERGGLVSRADLENYSPIWRTPLVGSYRGVPVVTMPPPGSGGVLLEMLNTLENFNLAAQTPLLRTHLTAQAMSRAYADRSRFYGDPAFVPVPLAALVAKSYGAAQKKTISLGRATPSTQIVPGSLLSPALLAGFQSWEGPRPVENTSHLSTMDADGNTVALTQTINGGFGAAVVAPKTGILLNNEMDDFAVAPGVPNLFGLVGSKANAIAPGKRPLSSMTPTILLKNGRPWIALGSPGGAFITNAVLQTILGVLDYKLPLPEAVNAPRIHHQWQPDRLFVEKAYSVAEEALSALGYELRAIDAMGNVQAVQYEGRFVGASDARREGTSAVWQAPPRAASPAASPRR